MTTSRPIRPALFLSAALLLASCGDADTVVREADNSERLAEYEETVEARGARQTDPGLPVETIPGGPDYTREVNSDSVQDRFAVPDNSPPTDVAKDEQVGATTCPRDARLTRAMVEANTLPVLPDEYGRWLLEEGGRGAKTTAGGLAYRTVMPGIERGYQPQSLNDIELLVGGRERTVVPDRAGTFGDVLTDMQPCEVVEVDLAALDDSARDALDAGEAGTVRVQFLEARIPG